MAKSSNTGSQLFINAKSLSEDASAQVIMERGGQVRRVKDEVLISTPDKQLFAKYAFHQDKKGFAMVECKGIRKLAGSDSTALNWILSLYPKTPVKVDKKVAAASKKAAVEPDTKSPKLEQKKKDKPAPPRKAVEKKCPVCTKTYTGRNRTCSAPCSKKRSAEASAEASRQMSNGSGKIYEDWKKKCVAAGVNIPKKEGSHKTDKPEKTVNKKS